MRRGPVDRAFAPAHPERSRDSPGEDQRHYPWKSQTLCRDGARAHPRPMRGGERRTSKSMVYSIRLHADQAEAIAHIADEAGIPPRGLVRGWVPTGTTRRAGQGRPVRSVVEALSRDVDRLRRLVNTDHPPTRKAV
jgi:hypothetical protein